MSFLRRAAPIVIALLVGALGAAQAQAASPPVVVRVNLVGFQSGAPKVASVMSSTALGSDTFAVIPAGGTAAQAVDTGPLGGAVDWSAAYPDVYTVSFDSVTADGSYQVAVVSGGTILASSPSFVITSERATLDTLLQNGVSFYHDQRDGPDLTTMDFNRPAGHLTDEQAYVYHPPPFQCFDGSGNEIAGAQNEPYACTASATVNPSAYPTTQPTRTGVGPIDVSGGWSDAGDYLKFEGIESYVVALMGTAIEERPDVLSGGPDDLTAEMRHGVDWLEKMWNDQTKTLYMQVGMFDGTVFVQGQHGIGSLYYGDHDQSGQRLPSADDALGVSATDTTNADYFVEYRPVFAAAAPGAKLPANLAGRTAAAFALCAQVFAVSDPSYAATCLRDAEDILAQADTTGNVPLLDSVPVNDQYLYETTSADDMTWGEAETALALAAASSTSGLPDANPEDYVTAAQSSARTMISAYNNGFYGDVPFSHVVDGWALMALAQAVAGPGGGTGTPSAATALATEKLRLQSFAGDGYAMSQGQSNLPDAFDLPVPDYDIVGRSTIGLAAEAELYTHESGDTSMAAFGQRMVDYILGDNAWGTSFIVGDGSTFPHCPSNQVAMLVGSHDGTGAILHGGIVGGPNTDPSTYQFQNPCDNNVFTAFNTAAGDPSGDSDYRDTAGTYGNTEADLEYSVPQFIVWASLRPTGSDPTTPTTPTTPSTPTSPAGPGTTPTPPVTTHQPPPVVMPLKLAVSKLHLVDRDGKLTLTGRITHTGTLKLTLRAGRTVLLRSQARIKRIGTFRITLRLSHKAQRHARGKRLVLTLSLAGFQSQTVRAR